MADRKYISVFMDRLLPDYLRTEYSQFEAWIRSYLEYCEQDGKVVQLLFDFLHYIDIDKLNAGDPYYAGDDDVLELYIEQYLSNFPLYRIQDIDISKLIKNAKDFYSAKGTERSYDFIFRLMNHLGSFSFYYPQDDIMKLSDAYTPLSEDKYLHDNFYRAYFTYEIRSTLFGYAELKDIIENLLHPAGCKAFFMRIIESSGTDYDITDQDGVTLVFHFYSLQDQFYPQFTYNTIYKDDYYTWTFYDLYYSDVPMLENFTFYDWGDNWSGIENSYGDQDFYPHQISTYRTLL